MQMALPIPLLPPVTMAFFCSIVSFISQCLRLKKLEGVRAYDSIIHEQFTGNYPQVFKIIGVFRPANYSLAKGQEINEKIRLFNPNQPTHLL